MPFIGYSVDGGVVEVSHNGDGTLRANEKASIAGGVVCAASASEDVLYYIPAAEPSSLYRWSFAKGKGELAQDLVRPHGRLFCHRNKVFCIPVGDNGAAVYDPLCNAVEVLPIPYCLKWAEPADHGFVFRTMCDKTFGYHMNNGIAKVKDGDQIVSFLGHYKRFAAVRLVEGNATRVAGVTESGEVVALPAEIPNAGFVECGDTVLHVDGTQIVSSRGHAVGSPIRGLRLTACAAAEDEVACSICLCGFDGGDGITLDCGHLFHRECVDQWVSTWMDFAAKGEHVTFTHAVCASGCKYLIRHPLVPQSRRIAELNREVTAKKTALLPHFEATKTDEDLLFYLCGRCGAAFYGGERVCSRMQGREPGSSPDDLVCDECLAAEHTSCSTFVPIFKCRYCCNPATHRSFGTRYMCERCNARWDTAEPAPLPCPGGDDCPFDGHHGEVSGSYAGCLLCSCDATTKHIFDRIAAKPESEAKPKA